MTSTEITPESLDHLRWAVDARYKNQVCSLKLLRLFEEHEAKWKTQRFSRAAQDLLAVDFSLWRAAFLADKTSKRADVFDDARDFLLKIVEDNTISYLQDKNSREWSFNYYTRNARYFLQTISEFWPKAVPAYKGAKRTPTERWDYCHKLLSAAIDEFERLLLEHRDSVKRSEASRTSKAGAKDRRRKVRALTLAQRKT